MAKCQLLVNYKRAIMAHGLSLSSLLIVANQMSFLPPCGSSPTRSHSYELAPIHWYHYCTALIIDPSRQQSKDNLQSHSWGPSCRKRPASPCGLAGPAWGPALRRLSGYKDPRCVLITPQALALCSAPPKPWGSFHVLESSTGPACPAGYRSQLSQLSRSYQRPRLAPTAAVHLNPENLDSNTDELAGRGLSSLEITCVRIAFNYPLVSGLSQVAFPRTFSSAILNLQPSAMMAVRSPLSVLPYRDPSSPFAGPESM